MNLYIILAAYNGARFIEAQLKSIQAQTVKDWLLLIRDDGSSDETVSIIKRLAGADKRITVIQDAAGNLGVTQNFAQLLQAALAAGAEYVAISDQDDIWQPEKLQVLLDKMQETEATNNTSPVLVHSDLEVVDEQMRTIHRSFMTCSRISPFSPRLESLLCQNTVTGCTCLINRSLLTLALPVPKQVPMHDWWLALLALACGKMGYTDQPLVRYRQHRRNVVGVKPYPLRVVKGILSPRKWRQKIAYTRSSLRQASLFDQRLQAYGIPIDHEKIHLIGQYSELLSLPRLKRLQTLRAYKIFKHSKLSDYLFKLIIVGFPVQARE